MAGISAYIYEKKINCHSLLFRIAACFLRTGDQYSHQNNPRFGNSALSSDRWDAMRKGIIALSGGDFFVFKSSLNEKKG